MRRLVLFFLLLFGTLQFLQAQDRTFVRIYNADGKKIEKGYLYNTTDSSVILQKGNSYVEIPAAQIDVIKSKRSITNRIFTTALKVIVMIIAIAAIIIYIAMIISHPNLDVASNEKNSNHINIKHPKPQKEYKINNNLDTFKTQHLLLNQLM